MSISDFILDKRVVDRNIIKGVITPEDVKKSLAQLPDLVDNVVLCNPDGPKEEESTDEAE